MTGKVFKSEPIVESSVEHYSSDTISANGRPGKTNSTVLRVGQNITPLIWVDSHGQEKVVSPQEALDKLHEHKAKVIESNADMMNRRSANLSKRLTMLLKVSSQIGVDQNDLIDLLGLDINKEELKRAQEITTSRVEPEVKKQSKKAKVV